MGAISNLIFNYALVSLKFALNPLQLKPLLAHTKFVFYKLHLFIYLFCVVYGSICHVILKIRGHTHRFSPSVWVVGIKVR